MILLICLEKLFCWSSLVLKLLENEEDGSEPKRIKAYAEKVSQGLSEVKYECTFDVPTNFGQVGAVVVDNQVRDEMYITNIVLDNLPNGRVTIPCNSWIHSSYDNPIPRIFFTNKSYLPSQTPSGLKKLRDQDLEDLRGNGTGERQSFDRIYDYDKYNDLGEPDSDEELARPVLGGTQHPYPRRCRTGRPPTQADPLSETKQGNFYVPRDENFSDVKQLMFSTKTLGAVLHSLVPYLEIVLIDANLGFPHFTRIDSLFDQGVPIPKNLGVFKLILPRLVKALKDGKEDILLFETPELMKRDKFSWCTDGEFSRHTLAGVNPYSIQLVTVVGPSALEWPMTSKPDPLIYGQPESAITKDIVERKIKGVMTLEEAMEKKRLFVLDYHDLLLPFVQKVPKLEGTTLVNRGSPLVEIPKNNATTLLPIFSQISKALSLRRLNPNP